MLGKSAAKHHLGYRHGFRWRGEEISRIEGLSDAVFAFALTLLIVSLEVPHTFDDLIFALKGFGAFAACFIQLMVVWYQQYLYYRRYNLQDWTSIVLTMTLLFFVLFYTYPLKFVFMVWLGPTRAGAEDPLKSFDQVAQMFTIYGAGYLLVFGIFAALYFHAYRNREVLRLSRIEIWDTLHSIREMLMLASVGVFAILLANILPNEWKVMSGASYSIIGVLSWLHGRWSAKRRAQIDASVSPNGEAEAIHLPT